LSQGFDVIVFEPTQHRGRIGASFQQSGEGRRMNQAEEARFREFVAGRSPALLRTAYLLVGDRGRAEDLVQTALIKTYLAWGRIRDPGAIEAYVHRVMATTATSWWRRRSSGERPDPAAPEIAVADASAAVAEADRVRRYLLTLPARQRAVLVLRFFNDLSEADVAEALGLSRGAVSAYTSRGLAALRERIGKEASRT
jgi:RNA polymerase sigma-70 factor (sigma-E family)